jgi:hypothetical protein
VHVSTPPTPSSTGQPDKDGRWLLCQTCHDLCQHTDRTAWVRHAWTIHAQQSPWLRQTPPDLRAGMRAQMSRMFTLLIERLDDGHQPVV